MIEEWRQTEYPGYRISNLGRVWNEKSGRIMKSSVAGPGYKMVGLMIPHRKVCYIHRLIAIAFIPRVDGKDQVNHKNGIKTDNSLENLEWCTHAENMRHARETGLSTGHLHAMPHMLAVTRKPVHKICMVTGETLETFCSLNEAMRSTGFTSIKRCVEGKQKQTAGFVWKYADQTGVDSDD